MSAMLKPTIEEAKLWILEHNADAGGDPIPDDKLDRIARQRVFIEPLSKETIAMMLTDLWDGIHELHGRVMMPVAPEAPHAIASLPAEFHDNDHDGHG